MTLWTHPAVPGGALPVGFLAPGRFLPMRVHACGYLPPLFDASEVYMAQLRDRRVARLPRRLERRRRA